MMDPCVIDEENDLFVFVLLTFADAAECLVDEVLKDRRVNSTFDQLMRDQLVLRDGCNQRY